ncbi:hypothetical protein J1614_000794 [Plenodomus biglobosus]|nr:hypothetical protein J1614_000794 [Plenodomus biglobosus]
MVPRVCSSWVEPSGVLGSGVTVSPTARPHVSTLMISGCRQQHQRDTGILKSQRTGNGAAPITSQVSRPDERHRHTE